MRHPLARLDCDIVGMFIWGSCVVILSFWCRVEFNDGRHRGTLRKNVLKLFTKGTILYVN